MFAATVQDSFNLASDSCTALYLTHLVGQPVPGDRFELAGATRLVTKLDDRHRTRDCLTAEPLQGAPHLLIAVTPALDGAERQQTTRRRISTGPEADQSLGQRHPDARRLRLGRQYGETAQRLDQIRFEGRTAILHPAPHPDIRRGQLSILHDGGHSPAVVILATHVETHQAKDMLDTLLRRAGYSDHAQWRDRNPDLTDDASILCHSFQLVEVLG